MAWAKAFAANANAAISAAASARAGRAMMSPLCFRQSYACLAPLVDEMTSPSEGWLAARGWQSFPFQREVWTAVAEGRSGLLHATTGSGKTYAVWLGMLDQLLA